DLSLSAVLQVNTSRGVVSVDAESPDLPDFGELYVVGRSEVPRARAEERLVRLFGRQGPAVSGAGLAPGPRIRPAQSQSLAGGPDDARYTAGRLSDGAEPRRSQRTGKSHDGRLSQRKHLVAARAAALLRSGAAPERPSGGRCRTGGKNQRRFGDRFAGQSQCCRTARRDRAGGRVRGASIHLSA